MSSRLLGLAILCCAACQPPPELSLAIRLPDDRHLLAAVDQLNLEATRGSVLLAQQSFPSSASYLSLASVSHGSDTALSLDGVDSDAEVVARGRTCAFDFEASGSVSLYFAPTNFFAPTVGAPIAVRDRPVGFALADGTVLLGGGKDPSGAILGSAEQFAVGPASFTAASASLLHPRWRAEAVELPSVGLLVTGGLDAGSQPIADAELFSDTQKTWSAISDPRLDARVGHRVVLTADGRAFLSGGAASDNGPPLSSTLLLYVTDGSYQVSPGPPLSEPRREHAATLAIGVPALFGGYGADGKALDSIEAIADLTATTATAPIAHLATARAEATASLLPDGSTAGSILVVGGVGADGKPLADAELFNPLTRTTTVYPMAAARHGHTATVLSDGRVLVAGGFDASNAPIASVEIFAPGIGFLTERSLGTARGNHVAIPLCDGTILVTGGGAGAEIYSPPSD